MSKLKVHDLTDVQNACLEAAQEIGVVSASEVVRYVDGLLDRCEIATIARPITKAEASRGLQSLCLWGILQREPRSSAGWGQGWHASFYTEVGR
jgi:hypothetical protein